MKKKKSMFKRIISLVLLSTFIFQLDGIKVLAAELSSSNVGIVTNEEQNQFIINSFEMDKKEIIDNTGKIKFNINISNPGLVNYITLNYWDWYYSSQIELYFNENTGMFEGEIEPNIGWIEGERQYNLESIYLSTRNGDITLYSENLMNNHNIDVNQYTYKVLEWSPVIKNIELESSEGIYPNGSIKVYTEVENAEKISSLEVGFINNSNINKWTSLYYNSETNRFEGDILIDNYYGDNSYDNVFLLDYIGVQSHYQYYRYDKEKLQSDFGIDSTQINYTIKKWMPEIVSVEIEKTEIVYPSGTSKISVELLDNSNITDIYAYYSNNWDSRENVNLYYNYETGKYEGTIYAYNYDAYNSEANNYNFEGFGIYTNDYSFINISRYDLNERYGIEASKLDYKLLKWIPKINSISVSNNILFPDLDGLNFANLKMEIDNPEQIDYAQVIYGSPYHDYGNITVDMYYNYESGFFEGTCNPYYYVLGTNVVKSINIISNGYYIEVTRNELSNNIDLDSLNIEIKTYSPESIKVDTNKIKPGETVNVELDLSNYPFDIEQVRINYNFDEGKYSNQFAIDMKYNSQKNIYEGHYTAGKLTSEGVKQVHSIDIIGENSYITIYNTGYETNLLNGNFEVVNNIGKFLYSLKIDTEKDKAEIGDRVKVSLSGINLPLGSITAEYLNIETDKRTLVSLRYNRSTNKWEGYFDTDTYTGDGQWVIDNISITENIEDKFNYITLYNSKLHINMMTNYMKDLSGGDIKVIGSITDKKAPEVISVSVDKSEVVVGDTVKLSIKAKDDLSGIKNISLYYSNNINYSNITLNDIKYNSVTGRYEVDIKINGAMLNGIYSLSSIWLTDNAGNHTSIMNNNMMMRNIDGVSQDLSNANFRLVNNVDKKSDLITDISIENCNVQVDDEVKISIGILNKEGIGNLIATYRQVGMYTNGRQVKLLYNEKTNKYEGILNIDPTMESGIWEIESIDFRDENDQYINYVSKHYDYELTDMLSLASINIGHSYDEALKLNSIKVDKDKVTTNNKVSITVDAVDLNGDIRKVEVEYISPDNKLHTINLTEGSKDFNGEFKIEKFTTPGIWKVNKVKLEDNERNSDIIYNTAIDSSKEGIDLSSADFEVYGTILDNKAPELLDIIVEKERVQLGDTIKISIKANDSVSGIKKVMARFSGMLKGGEEELVEFTYNNSTKMYEYVIDTAKPYGYFGSWASESTEGWIVSIVYLEDNVGNIYNPDCWNNSILASSYFYVDRTGKWFISELTDKSKYVEGVTEPNSNIKVTIGSTTYTGNSNEYGKFKIAIPSQVGKTLVNIKITNSNGHIIKDTQMEVKDLEAPNAPIVTTLVNNKTTVLEGKAEAGSTVIIEKEVKVFGGIKIQEITRTTADKNGNFRVEIPAQAVNTVIGVKSIDNSNNESEYGMLVVKNINRADVNADDIVNILDIAYVAREYNTMIGDKEWNADMDVNEDEVVDIFDIILVSKQVK